MTTTLILGYDASCGACARASERIRAAGAGRLEIRPLQQLSRLREESLGDNAPWAPTLIEEREGKSPKAWTGLSMGPRLTRAVGVRRASNILRIVSEELSSAQGSSGSKPSGLLGRRTALSGILGATAGAFLLSGLKPAAASPKQATRAVADLRSAHSTSTLKELITGEDARIAFSEAGAYEDLLTVSKDSFAWWSPQGDEEYPTERDFVVTLTKSDNDSSLTIVDNNSTKLFRVYRDDSESGDSNAEVFQFSDDGERMTRIAASYNGQIPEALSESDYERAAMSGAGCTGCTGAGPGAHETTEYTVCNTDWNVGCVLGTIGCVGCVIACGTGPAACAWCIGTSCGATLASSGSCCDGTYRTECRSCTGSPR